MVIAEEVDGRKMGTVEQGDLDAKTHASAGGSTACPQLRFARASAGGAEMLSQRGGKPERAEPSSHASAAHARRLQAIARLRRAGRQGATIRRRSGTVKRRTRRTSDHRPAHSCVDLDGSSPQAAFASTSRCPCSTSVRESRLAGKVAKVVNRQITTIPGVTHCFRSRAEQRMPRVG